MESISDKPHLTDKQIDSSNQPHQEDIPYSLTVPKSFLFEKISKD
jgi:hypothetical protein